MTVGDLIAACERCGCRLRYDDPDRLTASGVQPPDAVRAALRDNRQQVIAALRLERRLVTGEMKIDRLRAEQKGADADRAETFWCGLLEEYVAVAGRTIGVGA